jgi:hypothetical protein
VIVFLKSTDSVFAKNRYSNSKDAFLRIANILNVKIADDQVSNCCC